VQHVVPVNLIVYLLVSENQNPVSDIVEDSLEARNIIYRRGRLTLIAAPLCWTVALKLKWNGERDMEDLARIFASTNFLEYAGGAGHEDEHAYRRQQQQVDAHASHIENWLDARCPTMKPVGESEKKVRREHITEAILLVR